jgi:hypothetical protein
VQGADVDCFPSPRPLTFPPPSLLPAHLLIPPVAQIKLNLFRSLPRAPEPSGDPDEEEEVFSDPGWPHLNILYELLLRLVSMDHIDLTAKKKVIDPPFVRQLMLLFDSEDARERDYLKVRETSSAAGEGGGAVGSV